MEYWDKALVPLITLRQIKSSRDRILVFYAMYGGRGTIWTAKDLCKILGINSVGTYRTTVRRLIDEGYLVREKRRIVTGQWLTTLRATYLPERDNLGEDALEVLNYKTPQSVEYMDPDDLFAHKVESLPKVYLWGVFTGGALQETPYDEGGLWASKNAWYCYLSNLVGAPPVKGDRGLRGKSYSLSSLQELWYKVKKTIGGQKHPLQAYAKTSGVQIAMEGINSTLLRNRKNPNWILEGEGWLLREIKRGAGIPDDSIFVGALDELWRTAGKYEEEGHVLHTLVRTLHEFKGPTVAPQSVEEDDPEDYEEEEDFDEEEPEEHDGALEGEELDSVVDQLLANRQ